MELTVVIQDLANQCLHCFFITNVAGVPMGDATVFSDFRRDRLQLFRLASHQNHLCTQRRQFMRSATADATASAGDHHGLPLEQVGFED